MAAAAAQPRGKVLPLLKSVGKGLIGGIAVYFAADMASDIYTFCHVRRKALERVRESAEVAALVGQPYQAAPWYDGTLGFSHTDTVAHCTFQVAGAARTTDVVARAARRPGMRSMILYNALGEGQWDLVSCQAMFPGEGGLAAPRNLMEPLHVVAKKGAAAAAAAAPGAATAVGGDCLPCQQQQRQGQGQGQQQQRRQAQQPGRAQGAAAAAAAGSETGQRGQPQQQAAGSWWQWLWWGSSSRSSSGGSSSVGVDSSSAPAASPEKK